MHPVEHQWFLAKYIADDLRCETRNVGVILRVANVDRPKVRLLDPVPFLRPEHAEEWRSWMRYWNGVWDEKGGAAPFHWLTKFSTRNPHFHWQLAGSRMVSAVDFEQMFELLVKPETR